MTALKPGDTVTVNKAGYWAHGKKATVLNPNEYHMAPNGEEIGPLVAVQIEHRRATGDFLLPLDWLRAG